VNITQGIIVWGICSLFGLKFALFLGVIAFIIHFIPNIGAILSTILPTIMAIVQFDDTGTIIGMTAILGGAQFIMGNYVEPLIAGHKLNLNTVTVIFGLVFWGWLWGIAGMMLSVPLMVIIKLVLEQIPDMGYIARLMSVPEKVKS
jgi:predicted PurR-regulated permease PerM